MFETTVWVLALSLALVFHLLTCKLLLAIYGTEDA